MNGDAAREAGRVEHGSSDDPDVLDFSANTNPRVPESVEDVYREAFAEARTYPPDPPGEFRRVAAEYVGCDPRQVVPTPGGLAAIRLAMGVTVDPADSVLLPFPTFGEYAREVELQGGDTAFVPHDELLDADPEGHALAVACTPNNPTGDAYDPGRLRAFADRCRAVDTTLLVDEAFLGFTDLPSLAGRDGVVVARSLTKLFGLPGIRCGFAVATGPTLAALRSARRTWNVSAPALATGVHCMRADGFVDRTRERVRRERSRMRSTLADRFDVHPSDAPFLLVDVGDRDGDSILSRARERGLVLRDATTFRGLDTHVRVAVRLPPDNDRLLEVLADV